MMRWMLVLALFVLGGCATLSKDQCRTVDWGQQGERDAYEGYARERLAEHEKACGEHGVKADHDMYLAGFERGLGRFCRAQRGFDYGHEGNTYRNTCPVDLEVSFQNGYRLGKRLHSDEKAKSGVESRTRETEKKLKKAESEEERVKLRRQVRELDEELVEVNRKLRRLDDEITQAGLNRR